MAPSAPAVAPATSGEFLVAVGMFADRDRADRLVDQLTQAGLSALQRTVQLRRAPVQQVALGPFPSRDDASAGLRRLRALGGFDDAIVIGSSQ